MTTLASTTFAPQYAGRPAKLSLATIGHWFAALRQAANERAALRQLDDSQLKDIGVSRYDANIEAARNAFDLPARFEATLHRS